MGKPTCYGCGRPGAWTCGECAAVNAADIEGMLGAEQSTAGERRAAVMGLPAADTEEAPAP